MICGPGILDLSVYRLKVVWGQIMSGLTGYVEETKKKDRKVNNKVKKACCRNVFFVVVEVVVSLRYDPDAIIFIHDTNSVAKIVR
jgi:hypothetical protein